MNGWLIRHQQGLRFLLVGGSSSLLYALISAAVLRWTGWPAFGTGLFVFCLFVPVTFRAHSRITFRAGSLRRGAFLRYAALQLGCFAAVSVLTTTLVTGVYLIDAGVYLVTVAASAVLTFVVGRIAVFRPPA
jgi:putative flippase GtrA